MPAITLRTVLGDWLPHWRVTRLKIDAQGSDLAVLAAAGAEQLARVGEISLETLRDSCDGLYDGQPNCSTVVSTMAHLGFATRFDCNNARAFTQGSGCEANFVFRNTAWPEQAARSVGGRGSRKTRAEKGPSQ